MSDHIVTFGQRYREEPHPALGRDHRLPDGFGLVKAPDYRTAVAAAQAILGIRYSMVYIDTPENRAWYPLGQLFTIDGTGDTPTLTWTQENPS